MPIRQTVLAALLVAAAVVAPARAAAGPMTAGERQRLLAHLAMTEDWLVGELAGLSDAQLTFKMTPESWSIKDVAEHLAIAEPQYWTNLESSMKEPAKAGWKPHGDRRADALVRHRPRATGRRPARRACRTGSSPAPRRRSIHSANCARR